MITSLTQQLNNIFFYKEEGATHKTGIRVETMPSEGIVKFLIAGERTIDGVTEKDYSSFSYSETPKPYWSCLLSFEMFVHDIAYKRSLENKEFTLATSTDNPKEDKGGIKAVFKDNGDLNLIILDRRRFEYNIPKEVANQLIQFLVLALSINV